MKKRKHIKRLLTAALCIFGAVLIAAFGVFSAILISAGRDKNRFAREQTAHIAALEAEYSQPGFAPADEMSMTGFDPAANGGARLNELRFLATHNSYKAYNPFAEMLMDRVIAPLGFSASGVWSYGFETLSQQLDKGIRSFELDVMREKDGFRCAHIPVVDYAATCPDFALAMRELALWSEHHPGHLPITVLVEAKTTALSGGMLSHAFNIDDVLALEAQLADTLGERLYTPAEMLGDYGDFAQLRAANGYPELSALLGKIIVIHHYAGGLTEAYAAQDPTLRAQKMFLSVGQWMTYEDETADVNKPYACFLIDNYSDSPDMAENTGKFNFLVRTRSDTFPWHDSEWEAQAKATGAFILTTDYPPRDALGSDTYVVTFEDGATVAQRAESTRRK